MGLQGYVGSSQDQTRIRRQEKQREDERKQIEALKKETEAKVISAGLRRFGTGTSEVLETAFKNETVGLVTREEFLKKKNSVEERLEGQEKREEKTKRKQKRSKLPLKVALSFDAEEEEEEVRETKIAKKKDTDRKEKLSKYGKCPTVETEFLPDADRERQEQALREQLREEWRAKQEAARAEKIQISYCYWDGTGHRRLLTVQKGCSIAEFLKEARDQLSKDFRELRLTSIENLLYIKGDVILPHSYTFYDLMLSQALGKTGGALYDFDRSDAVRPEHDTSIEQGNSSVGKVVERHWYEKNKHIFPASLWELYDPDKSNAQS